jgi:hypothetical protein
MKNVSTNNVLGNFQRGRLARFDIGEVPPPTLLDIHNQDDVAQAVDYLVSGDRPLVIPFGNIIGFFSNPAKEHVQEANIFKGRPSTQTGSVTTSPEFYSDLIDWNRFNTDMLPRDAVLGLIDHLSQHGPIGVILPASNLVPSHLSRAITFPDGELKTVQLIVPGNDSPANAIFRGAVARMPESPFIFATSGNVSSKLTGTDGAAHHRFAPLIEEFAQEGRGGLTVVTDNEKEMRKRHPFFDTRSTTILNLLDYQRDGNNQALTDSEGRPIIKINRHGSAHERWLRGVLEDHGLGAEFPTERLPERHYSSFESLGERARTVRAGVAVRLKPSITQR